MVKEAGLGVSGAGGRSLVLDILSLGYSWDIQVETLTRQLDMQIYISEPWWDYLSYTEFLFLF